MPIQGFPGPQNQQDDRLSLRAYGLQIEVISAHEATELPPWVKAWIERWLPARRDKSGALVALLKPAADLDPGASALQLYLKTIAQHGRCPHSE